MEELASLAACSICLEVKDDYRLLACGHSFCYDDLEVIGWESYSPCCPICQAPFEGSRIFALPKDLHKICLAELALKCQETTSIQLCSACGAEAIVWCQEDECCFCQIHAEEAHKYGKSKEHTLVHPSKKHEKVYCDWHDQEMDKFCSTCQMSICNECFVLRHQGHIIEPEETAFVRRKNRFLNEWKMQEQHLVNKFTEERTRLEKTNELVAQNLTTTSRAITETFDRAVELLRQRQEELLQQVEVKEQEFNNKVNRKRKAVEDTITEIRMQSEVVEASQYSVKLMALEKLVLQNACKWSKQQCHPIPAELFEEFLPELTLPLMESQLLPKKVKYCTQLLPTTSEVKVEDHHIYGRGYQVVPTQDVNLSYVQVKLFASPECFIVVTNNFGEQIHKSFLKHVCGNSYRADTNLLLLSHHTYHIFCMRPKGEPIFYSERKFEGCRYVHPFHIKSRHTDSLQSPMVPKPNTFSVEMSFGYNVV